LKVNREHIVGLVCIAIAVAVLMVTPGFPSGQGDGNWTGPSFFPNVLAVIYLLLGLYQVFFGFLIQSKKAASTAETGNRIDPVSLKKTVLFLLLLAGYIGFFEVLGFIVTSLAFLILFMTILGVPPLKSFLYSTVFVLVIYLLFGKLFTIGLPSGILGFLEL
jgi:hypothetical protein